MIRFIDIRNQGTGNRFAFYDTVTDEFLKIGGEMAWVNLEEFECKDSAMLARCLNICPEWVNDEEKDDIEEFYGW